VSAESGSDLMTHRESVAPGSGPVALCQRVAGAPLGPCRDDAEDAVGDRLSDGADVGEHDYRVPSTGSCEHGGSRPTSSPGEHARAECLPSSDRRPTEAAPAVQGLPASSRRALASRLVKREQVRSGSRTRRAGRAPAGRLLQFLLPIRLCSDREAAVVQLVLGFVAESPRPRPLSRRPRCPCSRSRSRPDALLDHAPRARGPVLLNMNVFPGTVPGATPVFTAARRSDTTRSCRGRRRIPGRSNNPRSPRSGPRAWRS